MLSNWESESWSVKYIDIKMVYAKTLTVVFSGNGTKEVLPLSYLPIFRFVCCCCFFWTLLLLKFIWWMTWWVDWFVRILNIWVFIGKCCAKLYKSENHSFLRRWQNSGFRHTQHYKKNVKATIVIRSIWWHFKRKSRIIGWWL